MRFRKKIKIFPGFYLNISKTGITTSIGGNGASVTIGKNGTYLNTGVPGSGFYNRQKISGESNIKNNDSVINTPNNSIDNDIKSADTSLLTSSNLLELKDTILEAYKEKNEITNEILQTHSDIEKAKNNYKIACIFIIGYVFNSFKNKITDLEDYLKDLVNQSKACKVNIDILIDENHLELYNKLKDSFIKASSSNYIWDITSSKSINKSKEKSTADIKVSREIVKLELKNIDIVDSVYQGLYWQNINGDGDLYIYPSFVIYFDIVNDNIGLIDIKDFDLVYTEASVSEPEVEPLDSVFVKKQWLKTNKDGTPDKRFTDNYELPVYEYGRIELKTKTGLNECYLFSNPKSSRFFSEIFNMYKENFR